MATIATLIVVEPVPLSHYEHLEAALFLREWAKDKMTADELRLFLPCSGVKSG